MKQLSFKPMPVLSVVLVISVAILIGLGVWQYQRLQWKTALLAEVEASIQAPPFRSLDDVVKAISSDAPVDYRRIELKADFIGDKSFHVYRTDQGGIMWRPFRAVMDEAGRIIFAGFDAFPDASKDKPPAINSEALTLSGYVRVRRENGGLVAKSTAETNRWFGINPLAKTNKGWFTLIGQSQNIMPSVYIDVAKTDGTPAASLPPKRPKIANNHFDYMLTWWSFALIFIIIYLILHHRAGRLTFGA